MAEFILKDRHGKDRTFGKETIFVKGADGELMQFTHGTGNPVIESLEITENGTYTAPEGVDGYNPVVVEVPAPEIVLQEKTIAENGEYTADEGYDGLGKVTVNVEGSGSALKFYKGYVKLVSNINTRINVDFGFTPDFILLYPAFYSGSFSPPKKEIFATGISTKFASTFGISKFIETTYASTSSIVPRSSTASIDGESNAYLYNVDSTGFNLGSNYTYMAGNYTVVAIGL
jgi:hypothetical protein